MFSIKSLENEQGYINNDSGINYVDILVNILAGILQYRVILQTLPYNFIFSCCITSSPRRSISCLCRDQIAGGLTHPPRTPLFRRCGTWGWGQALDS